ncbi:hypothetical protein CHS0354_015616 [Potamilus streckersoni]|uniref:Endonuclease-reverse transcriptase n=1 Tax=Potamilus streckersoni TaxID=2493646 RepID=A0AAE0W9W3_9BIVA|nr:hypothetical protein CHS0354_015616 [Potamilus streckersoni]
MRVNGHKLGTVTNFQYISVITSDEGSQPEVPFRIVQTTTALARLKAIWKDSNITPGYKIKLMRSLDMSIFLYACEIWTLTTELDRRIRALDMRCYRRILKISYLCHLSNDECVLESKV